MVSPGGVGFLLTSRLTIGGGVGSLNRSTCLLGGETLQLPSAAGDFALHDIFSLYFSLFGSIFVEIFILAKILCKMRKKTAAFYSSFFFVNTLSKSILETKYFFAFVCITSEKSISIFTL